MDRKEEILKIFPRELRRMLALLPVDFEGLQEIRLRAGQPLALIWNAREYWLDCSGRLMEPSSAGRPWQVTPEQLKETTEYMSSYSLYAAEEEIRQGFITLPGGHRIGLAGQGVRDGAGLRLMKHISFMNIRVAHQIQGCGKPCLEYLFERSGKNWVFLDTLIVSPPGLGKTTLLRDLIRLISVGDGRRPGLNVGVVDERSELGACYQGVPQNDLGPRTDVLDGCPKALGMMMLVRSMAPQVIAVDEIGGQEDSQAIDYVRNCGCSLAATAHGASLADVAQKPWLGPLIRQGTFKRIVLLRGEAGGAIEILNPSGERMAFLKRNAGEARSCG